ncbi:PAM68 family protein [Sphaerothrix gracilis]|uniref:PAM68 family protein n=1 Tax=Sphaerothrix gracilis TaxID=3151835 RepID=UPI0031FD1F4E
MASESKRDRLPFEPSSNRKKTEKTPAQPAAQPDKAEKSSVSSSKNTSSRKLRKARDNAIPEVVSQRMLRRMALFSGLPTALGVAVFFGSYWLLTRQILEFPKVIVLLSTLGCFGLGVLGLSYGVLSASWDEERVGTRFGWNEFGTNFGRMRSAWRSGRTDSSEVN